MPSSGSMAHIKLDDDEFMIDRSVENHYVKRWFDMEDQENPEITGDPGKEKRNPESLFWTYTDWAGGEGNRQYDPGQPDTYDVGYELNPRTRGMITGRPNRQRVQISAIDVRDRPAMAIGGRGAWFGGGTALFSCEGTIGTWSEITSSATPAADHVGLLSLSANYRITAMAGDGKYIYYSAYHSGSSGSRATLRTILGDAGLAETVQTQQTSVSPYAGLAMMNGKLFGWTGKKLWRHDTDAAAITTDVAGGVTAAAGSLEKVFDTSTDVASSNVFSATWWADAVATENSIVMFYSVDGHSEVYEYKRGVGRPIWRPPYGFTIKDACYANGVMYFGGHWGGNSNVSGDGMLYALPMDTFNPFPIKRVRWNQNLNLQMQGMHTSYGYQIVAVAANTGRIFIYDAQADGLTMLDDLGGTNADSITFTNADPIDHNRVGGSITWGKHRIFSIYRPGAASAGTEEYQLAIYDSDRIEDRETDMNTTDYTTYLGYVESPRWDYGFPLDKKTLIGFHLNFKPITSTGQYIDVSYEDNEDGTFHTLTQISSTTTGASVGRVFLPVSVPGALIKFMTLKFRMTLSSGPTGTEVPPIVYAISAEAAVVRKRKEWDITVRVKDEQSRNESPGNRKAKGWRIRDWLETTIEQGNVVTFRDGYRYSDNRLYATPYSSHNVLIKGAVDIIDKPGEGSMRLTLRDVDLQDDN